MQRLRRYQMILSTVASTIEIQRQRDNYRIVETYPKPGSVPLQQENDFGVAAFLRLCVIAAGRPVSPLKIEVVCNDARLKSGYERHLDAPVSLTTNRTSATFAAADVERSLSTSIPEVVKATDRIVERYIETLDTSKVAARVRHLLIDLLPSGEAHQERVATLLHRSPSTLQRQLQAEDTSYREVLETTRDALAREYLADARFSHAQIAYMLGFSDQSNFSRAFKRWTGQSPRDFQAELQDNRSDPATG
jgi:AraC-like DNA-binding protein